MALTGTASDGERGRVYLIQSSAAPRVMSQPVQNESAKISCERYPAGVRTMSKTPPTTRIVDMPRAIANARIIHSR